VNATKRARYAKAKRDPGGFVPLPNIVIRSAQFAQLSAHAVKLLVDLLGQYNGGNNGDLCATWTVMQPRGWRSRDTLAKALAELIERGFVTQTRQGGRHAPSLYAVTFYALDEQPKLDVRAAAYPRGAWARGEHGEGPQWSNGCHAPRVNSLPINTPAVLPRTAINAN
jgi:hypothetical protein